MSDQFDFELKLGAAVKVFATNADAPFDSSRVAASALATARTGWLSGRPRQGGRLQFGSAFAVVALVVLAMIGIVMYVNRPAINVGPPAPSESPSTGPTTAPAATVGPTVTPTSRPEGIFADVGGWIAIKSFDGIWAVDPARRDSPEGRVQLSTVAATPLAWSPESLKLLLLRNTDDDETILVVLNSDGTETRLANGNRNSGAGFSPDGSQVIYGDGDNVYAVSAEGGEPQLLVNGDPGRWTLSPDGTQIAYLDWGHGDGGHSLSVMNVDGTGTRLVTDDPRIMGPSHLIFSQPVVWYPDGRRLAFRTEYFGEWVVGIDGSDLRQATPAESETLRGLREVRISPRTSPSPTSTASPTLSLTPTPSVTPSAFSPRRDGEFIVFTHRATGAGWDLGAQDPENGDVRRTVETAGIVDGIDQCSGDFSLSQCSNFVRKAEWSADGRWVAFQASNQNLDGAPLAPCGPTIGIWVKGPSGETRQLTTPCDEPPTDSDEPVQEVWEWSPVGNQLAYARIDGATDELSLIDPSTGAQTPLITGNIDGLHDVEASSLIWSPDGAKIAYLDRNSIRAVDADDGEESLLANSFEDVIYFEWSPEGSQLLVQDQDRYRIQVMSADGSDLHVVLGGVDACCETSWSPNGDRIVYIASGSGAQQGVWTVAPDGSNPVRVNGANGNCGESLPAWAPNGTQVAFFGCGGWVVENWDGTGDAQRIDELMWRSWKSGGLTAGDLQRIGQFDH